MTLSKERTELYTKLTEFQINVLVNLSSYWCSRFSNLAEDLKIPKRLVRKAVHQLRDMGLCQYVRAFSEDDGLLRGSGYILTTDGMAIKESINHDNHSPSYY